MMFKYQLNECSEISFALLQPIFNYNNKFVCIPVEEYSLLKSSSCFCHCCSNTIIKYTQRPYIKRHRVLFTSCCIFPFLYKDKVLYRSTNKYKKKKGIQKYFNKIFKNISVGRKNLEEKAKFIKNNLQILRNKGFKAKINSKFKQNSRRCVKTIRNTIFRGDLKILLVELVKSKLYSLKLLKTIIRAILNIKKTSLSIKSLKSAKIHMSLLKTILSQNHLSSNSIHSLIGGKYHETAR